MQLVKTWPNDPLGPLNVQVEVIDCSERQSDEIQARVNDGSNVCHEIQPSAGK